MKNFIVQNIVSGSIFQTELNLEKDYLNFLKNLNINNYQGIQIIHT